MHRGPQARGLTGNLGFVCLVGLSADMIPGHTGIRRAIAHGADTPGNINDGVFNRLRRVAQNSVRFPTFRTTIRTTV